MQPGMCAEDDIPQGCGINNLVCLIANAGLKMYKHVTCNLRSLSFLIWSFGHLIKGPKKF